MKPISYYRKLVIVNGAVPLLVLAWDAYRGQLGANSANYALHVTGILSLIFLFLSLAITPLRWLTGWGGWIAFRRSLGLFGFFYAMVHLAIYVGLDRAMSLNSTIHEIATRRYLQVGAVAVLLMVPLAITSTNAMVQRMGARRWKLLHRLAYAATALGVIHYYLLVKSDVRQPLAFVGVLTALFGVRLGRHYIDLLRASTRTQSSISPAISSNRARFWSGELSVGAIFQETPDVKTFRLLAPDGGRLPFEYMPGQYLTIELSIDGKRVKRCYTIASSPTRTAFCELSIKREPSGLVSRYIHDNIKVGDHLKVSAPAGKFIFTGEEASAVLLIAGGVGITPLMSIARYLTDKVWSGDIYFLVVAKSERDIIFREELEWLMKRFSRLHFCVTLTRAESDGTWVGDRGHVTASLVKRLVPNLTNVPVFICGPDAMMDATRTLLLDLGVPSSDIKTEAFVSPGIASTDSRIEESNVIDPDARFAVSFARSGLQTSASAKQSLLEVAEESSVELPFECRSGICGHCKTQLLKGSVSMDSEDGLTASEKAQGVILACQAHPTSNVVLDI